MRMQADVRQMEYALSSVERRMGGLSGTMARTGRNMSAAGRAMTIGVTAPILAVGGAAIKAAADWESAFAGVEKVLDDADLARAHITFREINDELRQLGREIAIEGGVNTLAAIAERGGALGIAADRIVEFTEVMAKLAATTDLTADAAADAFGHMNTTMQFASGEIETMASALVHLGNNGASTESEIVNMASSIAGAADIINIGNEEVLAWAAAMANTGEKTQAGATSIQRFFLSAFEAMTGADDKMQVFMDTLGMTQDAVMDAFSGDPHKLLIDFIDSLGRLTEAEQLAALETLDLGTERRVRAFLRLLANTENLTDANNALAESQEGVNRMDEEFAKRADTFNFRLQLLGQRFYDIAITLGETLIPILETEFLPIIDDAAAEIEKFAEWFKSLPDDVKKTAIQVGLLAAAAGPLMFIFGGVLQFLAPVVGLLEKAGSLLGGVLGGIGGIGRAFGGGQGALSRMTASPVFVTNWPPGMMMPGGGAGGPLAAGGRAAAGRGIWGWLKGGGLTRFFQGAFAVGTVATTADLVEEPVEDFAFALHEEFLSDNPLAGIDPAEWSWPFGPKNTPTILPEIFGGNGLLGGTAPQASPEAAAAWSGMYDFENSAAKMAESAASFDQNLTQHFAPVLPKLATNSVISALSKTTEMGLEGVGTSFQQGLKTGLDPIGDIATRILLRAEDPLAPPVMAEIQGHLLGLEEIQQTYLDNGDIHLAAKVQTNIDALNTLIGKEDTHRAVTERLANDAKSFDTANASRAATQTQAIRDNAATTAGRVDALSGTAAWWFGILTSAVNGLRGYMSTNVNINFAGRPIDAAYTNTPGFHSGAWDTGPGGLAFLHANEMVVPAKDATPFRRGDFWRDGGGSKTEITHVELTGLLPAENTRDIARELRDLGERGKMTPRRRLKDRTPTTLGKY